MVLWDLHLAQVKEEVKMAVTGEAGKGEGKGEREGGRGGERGRKRERKS